MNGDDVILYFSYKYDGNWNLIHDAFLRKENIDWDKINEIKKNIKCSYVTIMDKGRYPEFLYQISKPPFILYYYGNLNLVNNDNILGVVGPREPCDYSLKTTKKIIEGLEAEDCVIISGMAKGIDTMAHLTALNNNIPTIAVLGTGIDSVYPKENFELYERIKMDGLILSEYPEKVEVTKDSFSFRNRIITGISHFVFIPEVKKYSGTNVSLKYALNQGKDIFTLPYFISEDNLCNSLIQDGAKLIISSKDIIEEFKTKNL